MQGAPGPAVAPHPWAFVAGEGIEEIEVGLVHGGTLLGREIDHRLPGG